jgi:hypothetical protein
VIVTEVPTGPSVTDRFVMLGAAATVNAIPLLANPRTVTTIFPVVAPFGTGVATLVEFQLVGVAMIPLKVTMLDPWVAPKFVPVIVTGVPIEPDVGDRLVMLGDGVVTVKLTPLLAAPETVTTTFPVVAPFATGAMICVVLQLVGVAMIPLKVTMLDPWVAPKFVPVIVTGVPIEPDVGDKVVILGDEATANVTPLEATPEIVTTTGPVVAPEGTGTTMVEALQLVGVAEVPLKVTVLVPWVAPKFAPAIVTEVPASPNAGDSPKMPGTWTTVNVTPLLAAPATVTTTLPDVAPVGTCAMMLVALQLNACAGAPLSITVLVPWVAPKFAPVIVIALPTGPDVGDMLLMLGEPVTVKFTPLLGTLETVTTTDPEVAPVGTGATILVALQLVGVAAVPLKVTLLVPWVDPKFVPVIVTEVPAVPEVGDRPVMLGAATTVKLTLLLGAPETVTTTFPVVAPFGTGVTIFVDVQLVGTAGIPLNVTVLVPWVDPKFVPVIVTDVPTEPDVGERLVILGADTTVKISPLLAIPETVTTTFPVVAPEGTHATMLVALQLVGVATIPLNVTVLDPSVVPKLEPVIVTQVPTTPEVGAKAVIVGVLVIVNKTPLLATPETVTTTFPVVAPRGTKAIILVALQLETDAAVPLKVTVLDGCPPPGFWVEPKLVPVIVTEVPTGPDVVDRLVMLGTGTTVKFTPLLATPPTVKTTLPVVAPEGTGTTIFVALQLVGVAVVPLNLTVLVPCVAPKFVPLTVTEVPTAPEVGETFVMLGGAPVTVKSWPLLATPATVTTTLPVVVPFGTLATILVALQLEMVADKPLKPTVLVPCVLPKFIPAMVTDVPTGPEVGERLVIVGSAVPSVTINVRQLLATPPTVTIMHPVVAPLGTGTAMLVLLQLVGVATAPLNVTLLVPWVVPKSVPLIVTGVPTGPDEGDRLSTSGATELSW